MVSTVRRYAIEVAYTGTRYGGFQIQANTSTIQGEVEKALAVLFRQSFELTGSSRTDAGVHARSNFFHVDTDAWGDIALDRRIYNLNAMLPNDIVIRRIQPVANDWHARFSALGRRYQYCCYRQKDPFLVDRAFYFPYRVDELRLQEAAAYLLSVRNFETFSKRNTQVHTFECQLSRSEWTFEGHRFDYWVAGNRFLRGMVRGLVGTMLQVGTGKMSLERFQDVIKLQDCTLADFSTPAMGLYLDAVEYPGFDRFEQEG